MTRYCGALLCSGLLTSAIAQVYVPPDFYGEPANRDLGFRQNDGQVVDTDGDVRPDIAFYSEWSYPRLYMRKSSEMSFVLASVDTVPATQDTLRRLDVRFTGELSEPTDPISWDASDPVENFYLPHCGPNGVAQVHGYSRVIYQEVWPGISVHFYNGRHGQKIAFVVRPGGDPTNIQLEMEGQDSLGLDIQGFLRLWSDGRFIQLEEAVAYQVDGNYDVYPLGWNAQYAANNGTGVVGFTFDMYDPSMTLVLQIGPPPMDPGVYDEPGLCWSTYLGGSGFTYIRESAADNTKYFIGGNTSSSFLTFPNVAGVNYAVVGTYAFTCGFDGQDQLIWKTFLGGQTAANTDTYGVVPTPDGTRLYVGGSTTSTSFAVLQVLNGTHYYEPVNATPGNKGWLARLNPNDNGQWVWSTYLSTGGMPVAAMAMAEGKRLFVTGTSTGSLPTVQSPLPTPTFAYSGGLDGYLVVLDDNDRTIYGSFLGGAGADKPMDLRSVKVNNAVRVVLAGYSNGPSIQSVPCFGNTYCYGSDGDFQETFLMEFNWDAALTWSTYLNTVQGGSSVFWDNSLAIDPVTGNLAVGTYSAGPNGITVVPGTGWYQPSPAQTLTAGMIHEFSGVDRSCTWATYFHGDQFSETHIRSLQYDGQGNLFVAGHFKGTGAPYAPLPGMYDQPVAYPNWSGGSFSIPLDPFIVCFSPTKDLLWGTLVGGFADGGGNYAEDITSMLRRNGDVYVTGLHSKPANQLMTYFPLDESNGTPYFTDVHQGSTQGFVTVFCGDGLAVGLQEAAIGPSELMAAQAQDGDILVFGLPIGTHFVRVTASTGQLIWAGSVSVHAPIPIRLGAFELAAGIYLVQTQSGAATKLVAHP